MLISESGIETGAEVRKLLLKHNVFIIWDEQYNLGIPVVDEQHRGIVTTINSLHFGINNNYYAKSFTPFVDMITGYTRIHFQIEEAFMRQVNPAFASGHRELHDELMAQLVFTGYKSQYDKDPQQFLSFLKDWWINHICNEDMRFKKLLEQ